MPLGALHTGELTYLEAGWLITQLPMESAYKTALRDRYTDEELLELAETAEDIRHGSWSRGELLQAMIVDSIAVLTNVQLQKAGVKTNPVVPLNRPGVVDRRRRNSPQAAAFLDRIREQHRKDREQAIREGLL